MFEFSFLSIIIVKSIGKKNKPLNFLIFCWKSKMFIFKRIILYILAAN